MCAERTLGGVMPQWLRFLVFFLLTSAFWILVNYYVVSRFLGVVPSRGTRRKIYLIMLLVAFLYPIGAVCERFLLPEGPGQWLVVVGSYHIGLVTLTFCVFLVGDVLELGYRIVRTAASLRHGTHGGWRRTLADVRLAGPKDASSETPEPSKKRRWEWRSGLPRRPGRVRLAVQSAVLVAVVAAALWGGAKSPVETRVTVQAPAGTKLALPVKIAVFSDVHLGLLVDRDDLADLVAQVNELQPDVVLIPGDLFDDRTEDAREAAPILARLAPKHGVFLSTGNHEFYVGSDMWGPVLKEANVRVLAQESVSPFPGLRIAGVDDDHALQRVGMSAAEAIALAMAEAKDEEMTVLMVHRPGPAKEAVPAGADLVVSGHTHGGQIPPFQIFSPMGNQRYLHGLYEIGEGLLYVTSGAGTWGPKMRLFAPAEIVEIVVMPPGSEA